MRLVVCVLLLACLVRGVIAADILEISSAGRRAFVRSEREATYAITVRNVANKPISNACLEARQISQDAICVSRITKEIGEILSGMAANVELPVETRLRPGPVRFEITVSGDCDDGHFSNAASLAAAVGPMFADRMPVVMWGGKLDGLPDMGFTHLTEPNIGYSTKNQSNAECRAIEYLDECVKDGMRLVKYECLTYPEGEDREKYYRSTRDGKHSLRKSKRPRMAEEVSHPEMIEQARSQAMRNARLMGRHPGLGGLLTVSEARDHSFPSFNTEHMRYKSETGRTVPAEVYNRVLDLKVAEKRFPDGLVPEEDPLYLYYNWFWRGGDGWSAYCSAIADVYRKEVMGPFFSFWDPAVRCPPMWCAVKGVDFLNQWCYAVPEPMNVAGPLEEMFAMAAGTPGQQVMMMTQLICYRRSLAPEESKVRQVPRWLAQRPRAAFLTVPPDMLTESLWSMLAKPVQGVMFHGYGAIFETGSEDSYCFTCPETAGRLRQLLKVVVAPLGPTLKKLGRDPSPVAILESSTTALMGGAATYGWAAPSVTFMQRARLDPRVVYEDTIIRDGLKGVQVLYIPQCRFLTPKIVDAIRDFKESGGILVGDEETVPALKPDILVPVASFTPPALDNSDEFDANSAMQGESAPNRHEATWNAKAKMQQDAESLRKLLAERGFAPRVDSSSPEIVVYGRKWEDVPYIFALNDKRAFGNYVGQWGYAMEDGAPFSGEVKCSLNGCAVAAVYELSRGGELPFRMENGSCVVPLSYETNDGRLLALLPQKIANVELGAPESVERGDMMPINVRVLDAFGEVVHALLPTRICVFDAKGRELDGAGWTSSKNGTAHLDVPLNVDDPDGFYTVWCVDRASGLAAVKKISLVNKEEE